MNILGVRIDKVDMNEAVKKVEQFLGEDSLHIIFTPNPEILMKADNSEEFKKILNSSELNIADGNGIVWASEKLNAGIKERVAGYDFIHKIFELGKDKDISFYFFGAKEGVAEEAKNKTENKYIGVNVIGTHNGYFSDEEAETIVREINSLKPDILLVALGAPKQEMFIYKYRNQLKCKIAIGIGGCFDVMSGRVKRAPKVFIRLKLEWLYRGLSDFSRLKRLIAVPKFMGRILKEKRNGRKSAE